MKQAQFASHKQDYTHSINTLQTFLASKNPNDKSVFSGLVLSWSRFFMASEMANKINIDKKLKLSVNLLLSRKRLLLQLLNSCQPLNYVFYMQQIAIIARKMVHRHHHPQLFFEILFGNCSIITVGNLDPRLVWPRKFPKVWRMTSAPSASLSFHRLI